MTRYVKEHSFAKDPFGFIAKRLVVGLVLVTFMATFVLHDALAAVPQILTYPSISYYKDLLTDMREGVFVIPSSLGYVQDQYLGPKENVVIHIQDAHCDYYAQQAIKKLVKYFKDEYGITLVCLEGGVGAYDLSPFMDIENEGVRNATADFFVKQGTLNGSELASIENPGELLLRGVENAELYRKNLDVYRESTAYRKEVEDQITQLAHVMRNLKRHVYSKELMDLDEQYAGYKDNSIDFKEYLTFLIEQSKFNALPVKSLKNVYLLKQVLDAEDGIDFKAANKERDAFIDALKDRLPRVGFEGLVKKTILFRQGELTQQEYYNYLIGTGKDAKIGIEAYPVFQQYVVYVSLYTSIDKSQLMRDLEQLETMLGNALCKNEEQTELMLYSRQFTLMKKAFDYSLTKDDFDSFRQDMDDFPMREFLSFLEKETPKYKISAGVDPGAMEIGERLRQISRFYVYSFERDDVFLDNVSKEIARTGFDNTILVTGGFHTDNLTGLLRKKGYSYISILPRFKDKPGYESPYFDILAGKQPRFGVLVDKAISGATMQVASVWNRLGLEVEGEKAANGARIQLEIARKLVAGEPAVMTFAGSNAVITFTMADGEVSYEIGKKDADTQAIASDVRITDLDNLSYEDHEKVIDSQLAEAYADRANRVSRVGEKALAKAEAFFEALAGKETDPVRKKKLLKMRDAVRAIDINQVTGIELFRGHASHLGINIAAGLPADEQAAVIVHEMGAFFRMDHDTNRGLEELFVKANMNRAGIASSPAFDAVAPDRFAALADAEPIAEEGAFEDRDYAKGQPKMEDAVPRGPPVTEYPDDFVIIAPVFNEGRGLEEIIQNIVRLGYADRVLFVNDASTDDTADILNRYYANGTLKLRPLNMAQNRRKVGAIRAAMRQLQGQGQLPEHVVVCDGDSYMTPKKEGDGVEDVIKRAIDHMKEKGLSGVGLNIVPRVEGSANLLERLQGLQWKLNMFISRMSARMGGRTSVPGAGGVFVAAHLLEALNDHSLEFEMEDTETVSILRGKGRKLGIFHRDMDVMTDVPRTAGAYLKQQMRYQRGMQKSVGKLLRFDRKAWKQMPLLALLLGVIAFCFGRIGMQITYSANAENLRQLLQYFLTFGIIAPYFFSAIGNRLVNLLPEGRAKQALGQAAAAPSIPLLYLNFFFNIGLLTLADTLLKGMKRLAQRFLLSLGEAPRAIGEFSGQLTWTTRSKDFINSLNVADIGMDAEDHDKINEAIKKAGDEGRLKEIGNVEGVTVYMITGQDTIYNEQKGHAGLRRNAVYLTEDFTAYTALHEIYELRLWQQAALELVGMEPATDWNSLSDQQRGALTLNLREYLISNPEDAKRVKEDFDRAADESARVMVAEDRGMLSGKYFGLERREEPRLEEDVETQVEVTIQALRMEEADEKLLRRGVKRTIASEAARKEGVTPEDILRRVGRDVNLRQEIIMREKLLQLIKVNPQVHDYLVGLRNSVEDLFADKAEASTFQAMLEALQEDEADAVAAAAEEGVWLPVVDTIARSESRKVVQLVTGPEIVQAPEAVEEITPADVEVDFVAEEGPSADFLRPEEVTVNTEEGVLVVDNAEIREYIGEATGIAINSAPEKMGEALINNVRSRAASLRYINADKLADFLASWQVAGIEDSGLTAGYLDVGSRTLYLSETIRSAARIAPEMIPMIILSEMSRADRYPGNFAEMIGIAKEASDVEAEVLLNGLSSSKVSMLTFALKELERRNEPITMTTLTDVRDFLEAPQARLSGAAARRLATLAREDFTDAESYLILKNWESMKERDRSLGYGLLDTLFPGESRAAEMMKAIRNNDRTQEGYEGVASAVVNFKPGAWVCFGDFMAGRAREKSMGSRIMDELSPAASRAALEVARQEGIMAYHFGQDEHAFLFPDNFTDDDVSRFFLKVKKRLEEGYGYRLYSVSLQEAAANDLNLTTLESSLGGPEEGVVVDRIGPMYHILVKEDKVTALKSMVGGYELKEKIIRPFYMPAGGVKVGANTLVSFENLLKSAETRSGQKWQKEEIEALVRDRRRMSDLWKSLDEQQHAVVRANAWNNLSVAEKNKYGEMDALPAKTALLYGLPGFNKGINYLEYLDTQSVLEELFSEEEHVLTNAEDHLTARERIRRNTRKRIGEIFSEAEKERGEKYSHNTRDAYTSYDSGALDDLLTEILNMSPEDIKKMPVEDRIFMIRGPPIDFYAIMINDDGTITAINMDVMCHAENLPEGVRQKAQAKLSAGLGGRATDYVIVDKEGLGEALTALFRKAQDGAITGEELMAELNELGPRMFPFKALNSYATHGVANDIILASTTAIYRALEKVLIEQGRIDQDSLQKAITRASEEVNGAIDPERFAEATRSADYPQGRPPVGIFLEAHVVNYKMGQTRPRAAAAAVKEKLEAMRAVRDPSVVLEDGNILPGLAGRVRTFSAKEGSKYTVDFLKQTIRDAKNGEQETKLKNEFYDAEGNKTAEELSRKANRQAVTAQFETSRGIISRAKGLKTPLIVAVQCDYLSQSQEESISRKVQREIAEKYNADIRNICVVLYSDRMDLEEKLGKNHKNMADLLTKDQARGVIFSLKGADIHPGAFSDAIFGAFTEKGRPKVYHIEEQYEGLKKGETPDPVIGSHVALAVGIKEIMSAKDRGEEVSPDLLREVNILVSQMSGGAVEMMNVADFSVFLENLIKNVEALRIERIDFETLREQIEAEEAALISL